MSTNPQAPTSPNHDSPIIGIDLGTTHSLVAHCTEAGPVILESPDSPGTRSLPSVVRLLATNNNGDTRKDAEESPGDEGGSVTTAGGAGSSGGGGYVVEAIGRAARDHAVEFPTTTLHSVKRLMGRSVADLADDLQHLPYRVVEGPQHTARIALSAPPQSSSPQPQASITVTPQEISALFLRELKRWADAALNTDVTRAVITVPAYFDDAQRQATRDAGRLAGLNVLRIVNEPTAAALAYGLGIDDHASENPQTPKTETQKNPKNQGVSISLNTKTNPDACASNDQPPQAPGLTPPHPSQTVAIYDLGGGTFDASILRLQQTPDGGTIDQVLATDGDTHLGGDDFDQTLINLFQNEIQQQHNQSPGIAIPGPVTNFPPATQQAFRSLAEQTKIKLSTQNSAQVQIDIPSKNQNTTYTRTLTRDEFDTLITPLIDRTLDACRRALKNAKLTTADIDRVILVGGSTRVPLVRQRVAELFQSEPYTALNPDEVVALGASVQAAVLAGIKRDTLLLDVIPLSLGIETMGGAVAKLIVSNSTIPARATEMFSTYADGQTSVKIHVLQGERELVKDCRSLATFDLTGVPPMPAGLPKINVTFLVDANGILSVQAVEERSGRRAQIQVVPNHGLTRDEITQIENDSFTHARSDMNAHRLIDLRLNAKLDLRNIQKQLDRFAPHPQSPGIDTPGSSQPDDSLQLDPQYRAEIEAHMAKVQAHIDTPDADSNADAFQQALHDLDHATLRLAELNIARTLRDDT